MKTTSKLAPLAFAVAATLSFGAMAAGGGHHHGPGNGNNQPEGEPSMSAASILDVQVSLGNRVDNDGTENNALVQDALHNSSGNAGVNVAAGDTNQQANAAAISTADADFVFGNTATSTIAVGQVNAGNTLANLDVTNNAKVNNTANNYSGNLGLNVAAGGFNQQKNDVTIASSEQAQNAEASIEVMQLAVSSTTYNGVEAGDSSLSTVASGYGGHWGGGHPGQQPTTNQDVQNNANLLGSLNSVSGNVGVNVAAGGTNQQSNSLSIAAGCYACP
ncbi:hypothetical protein SAMN05216198_1785 [Halopseudomonas litoralis]|uniref:Curlin associated repeat-containing protein n=1 Tax=Halopseudomonas litoralis TaxID=797277 RepID=A0A1H1RLG0_9GAMM|nr:hypothetical protein [Halopseudomonas litoralis]SDS36544.1 hypothetical protein SAMN05216198_1785 [Halopseudomonas litoralis]